MTYISKKTRLFIPHFVEECDPSYFDYLTRKRSDGRLKRHSSCDDLRAWTDDKYQNYQYLLDLMSDGEGRPFSGVLGRYIPIGTLLDVLPANPECGDNFRERGKESRKRQERITAFSPKTDFHDSGMSDATDDLLRLTDVAMTKLEAIRRIVCSGVCSDDSRELSKELRKDFAAVSGERLATSTPIPNEMDTEEYITDYNKTLTKIFCLKEKLCLIQEQWEELNAHFKTSRQSECQPSSHMTVTELYNREEHVNVKRIQEKMGKLLKERARVLEEMCSSVKHLNMLKSLDKVNETENCPCSCSRVEKNNFDRPTPQQDEKISRSNVPAKKTSKKLSTKTCFQKRKEHHREKISNGKYIVNSMNKTMPLNGQNSRGSSAAMFASWQDLPHSDSQKTYNVTMESIPDRKFKSETTMTEVEQALRSYEQRLSNLDYLETDIEELKKEADRAKYFKKELIKRDKIKREHGKEIKRKMEELQKKNCELKMMLQDLAKETKNEHNELQHLRASSRCKAAKMSELQEEMAELKERIKEYKLSYENQNDLIERLEHTIKEQRVQIDRLTNNMARLCMMTEKLRNLKKENKKNIPRSRSYGPETQNYARKNPRSSVEVGEEMQDTPCCGCTRNDSNLESLNRPRSECGRRIPDYRCRGSLSHQQTYKDQSHYN